MLSHKHTEKLISIICWRTYRKFRPSLETVFFCHKTCLKIIFWLFFNFQFLGSVFFWFFLLLFLTVYLSSFSVLKLCFSVLLFCSSFFCRVRVSVKHIKLPFHFAEFFNVSDSCFFYHRRYMIFSLTTLQWMQSISKEKTSIPVILTFPFNVDRMTNQF